MRAANWFASSVSSPSALKKEVSAVSLARLMSSFSLSMDGLKVTS
jgi:hypothetical protein